MTKEQLMQFIEVDSEEDKDDCEFYLDVIRSVPYRTGISRHGNRVREILFSDLCLRFARTVSRARWTKNSCCYSTSITTSRATARKTRRRFGNICWKDVMNSQRCAGLSIPCSLRRTRRLHRISRKSMRICSSLRTTAFCRLRAKTIWIS